MNSQEGGYFVTICTFNRECLFGDAVNGQMCLNEIGRVVVDEWTSSVRIRKEIVLDEFIVMPNHLHGVVIITESNVGATGRSPLPKGPRPKSLGAFIAGFKSSATKRINEMLGTPGVRIWQRNYYEHIIRNEDDLNDIREYIAQNPLKWELDGENPRNDLSVKTFSMLG